MSNRSADGGRVGSWQRDEVNPGVQKDGEGGVSCGDLIPIRRCGDGPTKLRGMAPMLVLCSRNKEVKGATWSISCARATHTSAYLNSLAVNDVPGDPLLIGCNGSRRAQCEINQAAPAERRNERASMDRYIQFNGHNRTSAGTIPEGGRQTSKLGRSYLGTSLNDQFEHPGIC